jgi:predicted dehydrogenase
MSLGELIHMNNDRIEVESILIGYGSIGKLHLLKLLENYPNVLVIDPDLSTQDKILELNKTEKIFYSASVDEINFITAPKLAVIANWGPDHFGTFSKLVTLNINNFIIEKPLTDSFYEISQIKQKIQDNDINLITNMQTSYSYLPTLLTKIEQKYSIGSPIGIFITGGAKCIATVGIHYLALANTLFGERPLNVSANLKSSKINPRHIEFAYLEGSANWEYSNQRYLAINFLNSSQVSPRCEIVYKRATAVITGNEIEVLMIDSDQAELLTSPNKTAYPNRVIYKGEAFVFPDGKTGQDMVYENIRGIGKKKYFDLGLTVTEDLLSALVASETSKHYSLPIQLSKTNPFYFKKWNIS